MQTTAPPTSRALEQARHAVANPDLGYTQQQLRISWLLLKSHRGEPVYQSKKPRPVPPPSGGDAA